MPSSTSAFHRRTNPSLSMALHSVDTPRPPADNAMNPPCLPLSELTYTNSHDKARRHVTLKLLARSKAPSKPPTLVEGDSVAGSVSLSLAKPANIKSVAVEVVGTMAMTEIGLDGGEGIYVFLNIRKELWTRQDWDKTRLVSVAGGPDGEFSWPFSIDLPSTIQLKHGSQRECRLPPSFAVKYGRTVISYRVVATVKYGLFSSVYVTGTNFVYVPVVKPEAPSLARQVAYETKKPLRGPDDDPAGWHTLEPVEFAVQGRASDATKVVAELTVSLALPLCYTPGTSIPLWLTIRCSDLDVLAALSSPDAPIVRLRRIVENRYHLLPDDYMKTLDLTTATPACQATIFPDWDNIQTAVWWPAPMHYEPHLGRRAPDSRDMRMLQGEIHLRPTLLQSVTLGYFAARYAVSMYPPVAEGLSLTSSAKPGSSLQEETVEIASAYADGPRPVAYSPIQYDSLPGDGGTGGKYGGITGKF